MEIFLFLGREITTLQNVKTDKYICEKPSLAISHSFCTTVARLIFLECKGMSLFYSEPVIVFHSSQEKVQGLLLRGGLQHSLLTTL